MDTRDVLLVDVFADGPMTGTPVGVVLDGADLAADQRAAIADEFGAPGTAFVAESDDGWVLRVAGDREVGRGIHVAIAAGTALAERGRVDGDAVTFDLADGTLDVTLQDDGRTWVTVDGPDLREAEVTEDEVADALGLDVAAIRDVGADLPIVRASLGPGVLLVPVNFLEHLSGAAPDLGAVAEVLEATASETIYAYTFDTLSGDAEIHGLLVGPEGVRARTGGDAAACAAVAARRYGAFDHDRTALRVEQGDVQGRPARLAVRPDGATGADSEGGEDAAGDDAAGDGDDDANGVTSSEEIAVGGRTVTVLDGTIVVPPASEADEIIEV